jgi:hypothetical protein
MDGWMDEEQGAGWGGEGERWVGVGEWDVRADAEVEV